MYQVSDDYLKEVDSRSRSFPVSCVFDSFVLPDKCIRKGLYTDTFDANGVISIGNACAKKIEMTIGDFSRQGVVWKGSKFTFKIGLIVNGATEWVPWGTFWITDMNTSNDKKTINVIAYDYMYRLSKMKYQTDLVAPFHYCDLLDEFLRKTGLTLNAKVEMPSADDEDYLIQGWPEGDFSYADIAGHLAGMVNCNARISNSDPSVIEFSWYTPTGVAIDNTLYQDGFEKLADSELRVDYFATGDNSKNQIEIENEDGSNEGELDFRPFDSVDPADYPWLTFTYDEATLTASVRLTEGYEEDTTGFEIPYCLRVDGKYYDVTAIDAEGFENCKATKLVLPKTLETVNQGAFWGCRNITELTIPESVKYISTQVTDECSALKTVYYNAENCTFASAIFAGLSGSPDGYAVIVGNTVKEIPANAFDYSTYLVGVSLSDSVTKIGNYAFRGCTNLKTIEIPNNVTSIGVSAFLNCDSLTSVTIPYNVTSIGEKAFMGCDLLETVIMNCAVTTLRDNVFENCHALKNVVLPTTLEVITHKVFASCESLESIIIPNNVTTIGNGAIGCSVFAGCTALKTVQVGTSADCKISKIDDANFTTCTALTDITIYKPADAVSGAPWGAANATINWMG